MLPSDLVSKPLYEWSADDLNQIVEKRSEESQFLEFKEYMPRDRGSLGWNFNGTLHANERDGLAKEIVAFANANGGHLIVGIKETEEKPSRAEKLGDINTNVAELAERLRSSLNSVIDPPINGLRIQPISATDTGDGYLVIQVPQSIHAPHGFGRPPVAYVRRADRSEPMTMRDIQNVFWEARTRKERVEGEIAAFRSRFFLMHSKQTSFRLDFVLFQKIPWRSQTCWNTSNRVTQN
jgi:predicted HTH transcriptional regulator